MRYALAVVLALVLAAAAGALPARSDGPTAPSAWVIPPSAEALPLSVAVRLGTVRAFCSGFFIGSPVQSGGVAVGPFVVSAGHCPADESLPMLRIVRSDGLMLGVDLVAWSNPSEGVAVPDFALLRIRDSDKVSVIVGAWPPAVLNCDSTLKPGDLISTENYPGTLSGVPVRASGFVIAAPVVLPDFPQALYIAALPVGHGSSGGPAFGPDGRVVGIVVARSDDQPAWSLIQPIAPVCEVLHIAKVA